MSEHFPEWSEHYIKAPPRYKMLLWIIQAWFGCGPLCWSNNEECCEVWDGDTMYVIKDHEPEPK